MYQLFRIEIDINNSKFNQHSWLVEDMSNQDLSHIKLQQYIVFYF